jgi:hypothetical protein
MRLLLAILCFMLVGCYNAADESHIETKLPYPTTDIKSLKARIVGSRPTILEHDIVVVGRVISSDRDENFYRTIVVDDGTAALEVMMGISPLAADYPEGLEVALRLKDCCVGYQRGVAQVGAVAAEYESYDVAYLASREAVDRVVVRGRSVEVQSPRSVAIAELEYGDCGRLVRVDGVHLVSTTSVDAQEGDVMEDARWRGYALFKNDAGDSIAVYTRDYARFAEDAIPLVDVSLSGVVEWARYNGGRECYQLKMRYEEDCTIY